MANSNHIRGLADGTLLQNGKYRIKRFISSGGFGCTYEAEHTIFDKRVAIKELFVSDYCNRDHISGRISVVVESKRQLVDHIYRKFLEEAKAQHGMNHPGIVSVSDVFEENGTAYYVMDYIDGCSLEQLLSNRPLDESRALNYIRQVAEALDYVHSRRRLHLDIKPGNIMIEAGSDRAMLIDFGASKQFDDQGINQSTMIAMTPGYAAPEQSSRSLVEFSPAPDIYSLGATLYRLLSGETPLDCNARLNCDIKPLPAHVSATTRFAVEKAMALKISERPGSMREFLDLLDATTSYDTDIIEPILPGDSFLPVSEFSDVESDTIVTTGRKGKVKWILVAILLAVIAFCITLFVFKGFSRKDAVTPSGQEISKIDTVGEPEVEPAPVVPAGMVDLGLSVYWADSSEDVDGNFFFDKKAADKIATDLRKIPTKEQWQELMDSCQWTWEIKDNLAGYNVKGPSGESIFLPAYGVFAKDKIWEGFGSYWADSVYFSFNEMKYNFEEIRPKERYSLRLIMPKD